MEKVEETAVVLLPMQGPMRLAIEEAGKSAGVRLVSASSDFSLDTINRGQLVIAELPEGERRIPARAMKAAECLGSQCHLVLICSEPLACPATSLQNGRVTLMGPPLSAMRLASRMRMVLANYRGVLSGTELEGREWLSEHWWIAAYRSTKTKPPSALMVQIGAQEGLLSLFPPPGATSEPELMRGLCEILSREPCERERLKAIRKIAGESGVVHLAKNASRWLLYWPLPEWHLSITSLSRLPAHYELGSRLSQKGGCWSMQAFPGDVLLACTSSSVDLNDVDLQCSLREAKKEGGPSTWDYLNSIAHPDSARCGLLVEVR